MFATFYNVIAPVALITLLAFLTARRFTFDTPSLSRVVLYLATPALVFDSISKSTLAPTDLGQLALVSALMMGLMALVGWGLGLFLGLKGATASAFTLATSIANTGNFGLPLVAFAFGQAGLNRAVIIFLTLNILHNTLGIFVASSGSGSVKQALINIIRVPIPYAVLSAILINVNNWPVPVPIERGFALLGQASLPMMIVILGIQLAKTKMQGQIKLVSLASGLRLVAAPMVAFLVIKFMAISGLNAQVLLIQASMPTAVISIVYAEEFGSDVGFLSSTVLVATIGSFISLSLLLNFLI